MAIVVEESDSETFQSQRQPSAKHPAWNLDEDDDEDQPPRNPTRINDADGDYALALQLQAEEEDNQRRAQAAQHQQEDELSRQFLERDSASTSEQRLASTPELHLTSTLESRLAVHAVRNFDEEEVQPPRDSGWNVDGEEDPLVRNDDKDEDEKEEAAKRQRVTTKFFEVQQQNFIPDSELEKLLKTARVLTIADFLQHIDVNDRQDVLDLLDQQEQSTADDELLQRRFEQTTAVLRQECPDRHPDYLVKPSGKLSDSQAHLLNYPTFSISQRRDRRSQQCLHLYRRTSDGRS
ncbi:hypothetical protein D6D17_10405 [Aureobasidium pullulans]|nr:hypothetical protein D6D17_10405 [Aureobasidium pullulans]